MFDIDHFKRINDEFSHITGDYVLKKLVHTVQKIIRQHDQLFRFGGEEFLILLPEIDLIGALTVAEKLRSKVEKLKMIYNDIGLPTITISIGVVSVPQQGKDLSELMQAVDNALYRAKNNGRNRVEHAGDNN